MPGSPLDPRAEGANDLLREGATLCTRVEDVMNAIAPMIEAGAPRADLFGEDPPARPTEPLWDETDIFGAAASPRTAPDHEMDEEPSPVGVDELVRAARLPAPDIHMALLELEIAGRLERHGGNRVSLVAS